MNAHQRDDPLICGAVARLEVRMGGGRNCSETIAQPAADVVCRSRLCPPMVEVRSVHSQPAARATRLATFERLHADGRQAVLTGTHQVECAPADGGPRWAAGAVLRPDPRAAQAIEQVARAAAAVVGAAHSLAG